MISLKLGKSTSCDFSKNFCTSSKLYRCAQSR